jgi:dTDP-4-amino-4,6-dideoxygalactose transaminase
MRLPTVDLPAHYRPIARDIHRAIDRVMRKGDFVFGRSVGAFEEVFARSCGVAYGVGVNSGTDALWIGLSSLGVGRGDEVITTAYTFFATASAIALAGARPVPVDIDPVTYNLDPERVEAAVTRRTKAILAVHLFGQPAQMDRLCAIARRRHLLLIEDCAQAHGARFGAQPVGSFGHLGAFSFYPTKNLSAMGDGGMIVTNRRTVRDQARLFRDHGRVGKYLHTSIGRNSRLDTIQAAILLIKLRRLNRWNRLRIQHARRYTRLFRHHSARVVTPVAASGRTHVFHLYVVRVPSRDRVVRELNQRGIQALVHYPVPFHLQPAFRFLGYRKGHFPVAERLAREAVSLPIYPEMRPAQIERVAQECMRLVGG